MEKEKENDYETTPTKEHHEYADDDADDFCDWERCKVKTLAEILGFEPKMFITEEEKVKRELAYVEYFGIVQYKRKPNDNRLYYYANYPKYLAEPRKTYKVTVHLNTMTSERKKLTKWREEGNANLRK